LKNQAKDRENRKKEQTQNLKTSASGMEKLFYLGIAKRSLS
jgi:hypothetical protein